LGSPRLQDELSRNRNPSKRGDALGLLALTSLTVKPARATWDRADLLQKSGYAFFDALHLALAEQAGAPAASPAT
jgi:hypothetical protein